MPKILIVDDDAEVRALLADVLSGAGYLVRLACNGQEALEILRHERGWVILLDWHMPQLDGAGVLEHLVDHPTLREGSTIILMSATMQFQLEQLRRFAGVVTAFLEKPFDLDEALAVVQASSSLRQRDPTGWRPPTTSASSA
jgi:CheY-like chemotaxis protein